TRPHAKRSGVHSSRNARNGFRRTVPTSSRSAVRSARDGTALAGRPPNDRGARRTSRSLRTGSSSSGSSLRGISHSGGTDGRILSRYKMAITQFRCHPPPCLRGPYTLHVHLGSKIMEDEQTIDSLLASPRIEQDAKPKFNNLIARNWRG